MAKNNVADLLSVKALLMDKDCSFRIARSDRLLIIREKLEEFIDSSTEF